jgi:hypothetical protein
MHLRHGEAISRGAPGRPQRRCRGAAQLHGRPSPVCTEYSSWSSPEHLLSLATTSYYLPCLSNSTTVCVREVALCGPSWSLTSHPSPSAESPINVAQAASGLYRVILRRRFDSGGTSSLPLEPRIWRGNCRIDQIETICYTDNYTDSCLCAICAVQTATSLSSSFRT